MKDSQSLSKKNNKKNTSRAHFFDTVIILLLLNIAAVTVIIFYLQRINFLTVPEVKESYLNVSSVPLSPDLTSINASAEAYVVYDTTNRTVIAGKNHTLRFSPASTAKVMSAIVALEHFKEDQLLKVPANIYSIEGSKMHLAPGELISVKNLIYGMMLPSGNDASYTIAYSYPGGVEGFVREMNKKAQELQLSNTFFLDPSGYEDGNFTTASELARLGAYALENKTLSEIVKTRFIEVTDQSQAHKFYLNNLNELLAYDNVVGIKTGFTNEAGGVLLTAVKRGNSLFIVSVLKSQDRFSDTKDIMSFIYEKIQYAAPLSP